MKRRTFLKFLGAGSIIQQIPSLVFADGTPIAEPAQELSLSIKTGDLEPGLYEISWWESPTPNDARRVTHPMKVLEGGRK